SGPVTGRGHSGEVRVEHGHQRRVHHLRISEAGVVGDVDRSGGVAEDFRAEPEPFAFDRRGENAIVRHVPDQRHGVDVPLTQPLGHIGVGVYGAEFLDHGLPAVLSTPRTSSRTANPGLSGSNTGAPRPSVCWTMMTGMSAAAAASMASVIFASESTRFRYRIISALWLK